MREKQGRVRNTADSGERQTLARAKTMIAESTRSVVYPFCVLGVSFAARARHTLCAARTRAQPAPTTQPQQRAPMHCFASCGDRLTRCTQAFSIRTFAFYTSRFVLLDLLAPITRAPLFVDAFFSFFSLFFGFFSLHTAPLTEFTQRVVVGWSAVCDHQHANGTAKPSKVAYADQRGGCGHGARALYRLHDLRAACRHVSPVATQRHSDDLVIIYILFEYIILIEMLNNIFLKIKLFGYI